MNLGLFALWSGSRRFTLHDSVMVSPSQAWGLCSRGNSLQLGWMSQKPAALTDP